MIAAGHPKGEWLIGCEESGRVRDAMLALNIPAVSCDLLPSRSDRGEHLQMDLIEALRLRPWRGLIAFPTCTYLTCSAEWAYKDPDFTRYPDVGYHQRLQAGTLFGAKRRMARQEAIQFALLLWNCGLERVVIENPVGILSQHLGRPPTYQPYEFGDDASKRTCFWFKGVRPLVPLPRWQWAAPRMVDGKPRWANQTDGGQNKLSPGEDRARDRSETFPGIASALAEQIGRQ